MEPEERQEFAKKIMSPLESITKHLTDHSAIVESKLEENQGSETTSLPITRYHEMTLDDKNEKEEDLFDSENYSDLINNEGTVGDAAMSPNQSKANVDEDYSNAEKYEINAQKIIVTTEKDYANCDNTTIIDNPKTTANKSIDLSKDTNIIKESQHFSLLCSD